MTSRIPFACALLVCKLCAQDPSARLVGSVLDGSNSAVAGAKVEIRNTATNEVRETESDDRGEFTAPNLPPGRYLITISKKGFRTQQGTNLELQLAQQARMEFHLELGSITQTVTVQALAPLINTENAVKGEVVVAEQMIEIPLNGRDFTDLALLTPGVLPNAQGGAGSAMAINGARGWGGAGAAEYRCHGRIQDADDRLLGRIRASRRRGSEHGAQDGRQRFPRRAVRVPTQ